MIPQDNQALQYAVDPKLPLPIEVVRGGPVAIHQAYVQMREELRSQVERLEEQRADLAEELRDNPASAANSRGLEGRISVVDSRITGLEKQIELVDAAIAKTGTYPGVVSVPPRDPQESRPPSGSFPEELIAIPALFILLVIFPLTIAYARRIWRKSGTVGAALPSDVAERLARMDQNIDTIALEIERIGESQRYLTKQHADQLGAGAAHRVEVGERDKIGERR